MSLFPPESTDDDAVLLPGVTAILDRHGISGRPLRFEDGSLPVYAVDDLVLKLYPPIHRAECALEAGVLADLAGRLPTPTPEVVATGELDGWGYLLMTRLRGRGLSEVWPTLSARERDGIADQLGETLALLHKEKVPTLPATDWGKVVIGQRARLLEHHRKRELDEVWLEQLDGFLDTVDLITPREPVPLHTEVMPAHLLVGPDGRLSGLFDFEPAMRGAREYEFASVGLFFARGDGRVLKRVLKAYGFTDIGPELSRQLLGMTIIHVYSNLGWYMRELGIPAEKSLDALARHWFPL
ncbi:aminoglycoside 3'-phosphotransferase/choline kinase family protein [Allokutzneria multivorans]|uniref:Aminoglycoside 3'-phosphotransferase/choline kinase family protein n=1 Tax=Allokutzneria multivorans TaxID=1142134 RepID=A0ABP7TYM2_9PSEU